MPLKTVSWRILSVFAGVLRALSNPDTRIGLIGVQEGQGRKGDAEMAGQQQQRDNSETAALLARMKKADPPAEILEVRRMLSLALVCLCLVSPPCVAVKFGSF